MATLITGASAGIGAEFARRFAAEGHDLILVARREAALDELAGELRSRHGVTVTVIAADLARPESAAELVSRTTGLGIEVGVLVNNAGFGTHGELADADPYRLTDEITLNCTTLRELRGGKPSFVDGTANALTARVLTRLVPRRVATEITGRVMGRGR